MWATSLFSNNRDQVQRRYPKQEWHDANKQQWKKQPADERLAGRGWHAGAGAQLKARYTGRPVFPEIPVGTALW